MKAKTLTKIVAAFLALSVFTTLAVQRATPPPSTVILTWNPSPSPGVTNYNMYYGSSTGYYTNVVPAGTNLTVTVSNLVRGATYFFAATAVDANNLESIYSNEVSVTTPTPPNAPTNLHVTGVN